MAHPTHLNISIEVHTTFIEIDGKKLLGVSVVEVMKRDYHGYVICTETDVRGAEYGETIYVEDVEGDFATDENAADYIDNILGENDEETFVAYQMEHSLRSWQLV